MKYRCDVLFEMEILFIPHKIFWDPSFTQFVYVLDENVVTGHISAINVMIPNFIDEDGLLLNR